MATVIHELISGGVVEYESTPELKAFLPRVLKLLKDPTKSEDDMIEIVYGPTNDKTLIPGRGAVTKAILGSPIYRMFTDLLERKRRQQARLRQVVAPSP